MSRDDASFSTGIGSSGVPAAGSLLVATPQISEPTFARSVILVLECRTDGALGVVLNSVSPVTVGEVLPQWADVATGPAGWGGPVERGAAVGVGRLPSPEGVPWAGPLAGPWSVVDLGADPSAEASAVEELRVFLGYAGWGAGQLEAELSSGSWWVVASQPGDLTLGSASEREPMWRAVLARQPNELRLVQTFPDDPAAN